MKGAFIFSLLVETNSMLAQRQAHTPIQEKHYGIWTLRQSLPTSWDWEEHDVQKGSWGHGDSALLTDTLPLLQELLICMFRLNPNQSSSTLTMPGFKLWCYSHWFPSHICLLGETNATQNCWATAADSSFRDSVFNCHSMLVMMSWHG